MRVFHIVALVLVTQLCAFVHSQACPDADPSLLPWSSPSTWPNNRLPRAKDTVTIPSGRKILLDISPPPLLSIIISPSASLVWKHVDGIELLVDNIQVSGSLIIGSETCKFVKKAIITLTGKLGETPIVTSFGSKFIGVYAGGTLELHGKDPSPSWTNLNKTIPRPEFFKDSDLILTLAQAVTWQAGDEIVLGTTDYTYLQSEVVTLTSCPECASNQVKLAQRPLYSHYGEISFGVDERAEIGLLTRSIVIRGQMEDNCYGAQRCQFFDFDGFGGHTKVIEGFKKAYIENTEFAHLGQLQELAFYPVHFHNTGNISGRAYVKNNSIHHSYSRCVTIHGTNELPVIGNVAFDHFGHCFFIEDGVEERNVLDGNLGLLTRWGALLPTDRECSVCIAMRPTDFNGNPNTCAGCAALATFWITNPNNILRNNVAGGSAKAGIWYVFPTHPTGDAALTSAATTVWPQQTPLGEFYNNKIHSNGETGMMVDNSLQIQQQSASYPLEQLSLSFGGYRPRKVPGNLDSPRVPAVFDRLTVYRNRWRGVWVRGGDIRFNNSIFAEHVIGVTLASEGAYPIDFGSSQDITNSLFVGETNNLGQQTHDLSFYGGRTLPSGWWDSIRGYELYDGPQSLTNSKFVNYVPNERRDAMGVSWLQFDEWQLSPANFVQGLKFEPAFSLRFNKIREQEHDGLKNIVLHDKDGSLTNFANSYIVNYTPFFFTQNCTQKPQENGAVCVNQKYGQLWVENLATAATVYNSTTAGVFYVRDEQPTYRHELEGLPNAHPRYHFISLVQMYKTYTLHFPHPTPPQIFLTKVVWDKGDYIRLGICYPRNNVAFNVQYRIRGYFYPMTQVYSLNLLTSTTYFHDTDTGLLFLSLVQAEKRDGWSEVCATGTLCEGVRITATGVAVGANIGDCTAAAYPKYTATIPQIPADGSCGGIPNIKMDACGVCNGDGSTCVPTGGPPPTIPPIPTTRPTARPTARPTITPTTSPTTPATASPTNTPTTQPTTPPVPTTPPTNRPTTTPSAPPTTSPTTSPTTRPSYPTASPTTSPTTPPTTSPTTPPTSKPPTAPTTAPTATKPPTSPTTPPTSPPTSPPSSPTTTIKLQYHVGSSLWWYAVAVQQASEDTATVSARDSSVSGPGSTWQNLEATNWGYWIFATAGYAIVPPVQFRLTSTTGKQVTLSTNSVTPGAVTDSGQQYK